MTDNYDGLDAMPDTWDGTNGRCVVCKTPDVQDTYQGKAYCQQHLQERMARETGVGY
jgi:hypothetical protein